MAKTTTKKNKAQPGKPAQKAAQAPVATKKEQVLTLLRREGGATLEEVVQETGWLPHTARAVFTGLRKKGFSVERTRADGVTRYAIKAEPSA